jgi:hypothetical protein
LAKRWMPAIAAVLLLTALCWAGQVPGAHGLVFFKQDVRTVMTDAEFNDLKSRIEAVYPQALEDVIAFLGRDKEKTIRKHFKELYVAIYDIDDTGNTQAHSYMSTRSAKRPQAVTFFAQNFMTRNQDIKTVLVHEMLHAAMEKNNRFHRYVAWPDYVHEGVSYFGSGDELQSIIRYLNRISPNFDFYWQWEKRKTRRAFYRERTFLYCFDKTYGPEARQKLVDLLFGGKKWSDAIKKASGVDSTKRVRKACDECTKALLRDILSKSGPVQQVIKLRKEKKNDKAIALAQDYLATNPEGEWRITTAIRMGFALAAVKRNEEAAEVFEQIRQGHFGSTNLEDAASFQLIKQLALLGKCDEAKAKQAHFARLYPVHRTDWKKGLDEAIAAQCSKERPPPTP